MNEHQKPPKNRAGLVVGVLAVALVILLVIINGRREHPANNGDGPNVETKEISAEEAARLYRLMQAGNGHLENVVPEELKKAAPKFEELTRKLPQEPLGYRNLMICRYLIYFGESDIEKQRICLSQFQEAAKACLQLEPDSPVGYWLMAQAVDKANPIDPVAGMQEFGTAADKAGKDARFKYALYEAAKAADETYAQVSRDALADAYDLEPDNLFIMWSHLLSQAESQDTRITGTLKRAKQTVSPLRRTTLEFDLHESLDAAIQAAEAGQWSDVLANIRGPRNVTIHDDFAQSDIRWLTPFPLEYMLHDLSADFHDKHPQVRSTESLIDVEFVSQPDTVTTDDEIRDAILVDFDLDGQVELVVVTKTLLAVYHHTSDQPSWSLAASSELTGEPRGVLAADLDWDLEVKTAASVSGEDPAGSSCYEADVDFVVYGDGGVTFIRNARSEETGERKLEVVHRGEAIGDLKDVTTAILVDFDHDCNLDIVLATKTGIVPILAPGNWEHPNINFEFADVASFSSMPVLPEGGAVTSLTAVDWDRDVDIDIVAVVADDAVGYLENLRHGNFRWRPFDGEYASLVSANSLAVIESDGNVSWDVVGGGKSGIALVQTSTFEPGAVTFKASHELATRRQDGILACDFDNNGYQDIVGWTPDSVSAWRGAGEASFSEVADLATDLPSGVQKCVAADLDADGDLDLCVVGSRDIAFYNNNGGNQNNWLTVRAVGTKDNRGWCNHHALGSLIEVKAGPMYQTQVVSQPVTHFGLGQEERADVLRFVWTNGRPQDVIRPELNTAVCEIMKPLGSCPYIYTWTGERYEFFTDCLWAAPIGLQLAEDVLAPTRSWEYLRIPGDRLKQRDGKYWLQLTEELWEAGYFDQVGLIAVDHPPGTEVYSNEKVGPASISEYKLHTVRERRYPVAALDQRGRNLLPKLRSRDADFAKAFDRKIVWGLAEDHYLEFDLGHLDSPKQVTLFMTGWIFPTNTSTNVALSRHPIESGPKPPSVFVPDGDGKWQQVQAYMGFPGGKTKTIAIDLSKAFLADDYRVRIATSAEIYWDEVFFTVDEEPVDLRRSTLTLDSAELHYRGFSQALPRGPNAPRRYDYASVSRSPQWPPMKGNFTRYGDVRELLAEADDRMAILATGDEMTISFLAPKDDPPEGWVRDFVMHNVGYDKDADLNTVYGQTVEPLPYQAMTAYPYPPDSPFPSTTEHVDYLQRYQTRTQDATQFWRRIKMYEPSEN